MQLHKQHNKDARAHMHVHAQTYMTCNNNITVHNYIHVLHHETPAVTLSGLMNLSICSPWTGM